MFGKGLQLKTTALLIFFSVISKVFKKPVNDMIVDHVEKFSFFSDFQYDFRSFRSTADLLTVVSDRIARAFNRSGATRAVALDVSKVFDRFWHAGHLHKLRSNGITGRVFGLNSSFLSNRRLQVVLEGNSSQEYSFFAEVLQSSILGPTFFLLYINDLPDAGLKIIFFLMLDMMSVMDVFHARRTSFYVGHFYFTYS